MSSAGGGSSVTPVGAESKGVPVFNSRRRNTQIVTKKANRRRASTYATSEGAMHQNMAGVHQRCAIGVQYITCHRMGGSLRDKVKRPIK